LKPVGETEFVAGIAAQSDIPGSAKAIIAGIVSDADLSLGAILDHALDAHEDAGRGLFRGIRHAGAHHPHPEEAFVPVNFRPGLFLDEAVQAGVRLLGQRGYSYESWHYHFQLRDFHTLAKAAPETIIILDHLGFPHGTKSYRNQREAIFQQWQVDIATLATCPNVYVKLGGLAWTDPGFGWHEAAKPATSDELVAAQKRYYLHAIDCFGPQRCMFESNFPVDKMSISYDQASHWQEVTALTGQLNESPYYHEWCVFDTALTSLWSVLLPDFWQDVATHPTTTPDSADDARFASPDPAHCASLAWAGGRWTPADPRQWRYDDQRQMWLTENPSWYFEAYGTWDRTTPDTIVRRRAFWEWWLTHPFQVAWAHIQPG
jgi:predicted TIM-barrel fold metal-dependent hydrolase